MKIGILGGSFDPIHTGHAVVANELVQRGVFDRVWLVPARINPFKTGEERPVDGAMRTEMCRLVADRCKGVEVNDIEQSLPEPSYTYRTLCALSRQYPEHTFRVIIGSDNWEAFGRWRDADRILNEYGVTYIRGRAMNFLPKCPRMWRWPERCRRCSCHRLISGRH